MPASKIIDLIAQPSEQPQFSLEFFPPRTEEGIKNLKARMARMKASVNPLFTDITWGAGGSTAGLSMDLGIHLQETGHASNLHMTCTNLQGSKDPVADIRKALQQAKDAGIRNIVALRGDPPAGADEWEAAEGGFSCALDLVKFMKKEFQDSFGISVAGYPEGHPNAISKVADVSKLTPTELARSSTCEGETFTCLDADYAKEMSYLKEKIDAGGDLIITQMFFDVSVYHQFVKDCRAIGITCPIVPGLMCLTAAAGFQKMTKFCKTRVPTGMMERVLSSDDVKTLGVEIGAEMCQDLLSGPEPPKVLHFYTLNLEKVVYGILQKLGFMKSDVEMNEADAATQVATGSAWARVGDAVQSVYGQGVVTHLDPLTAAARVEISNWELANQQKPVAFLQKGHYKKVFA